MGVCLRGKLKTLGQNSDGAFMDRTTEFRPYFSDAVSLPSAAVAFLFKYMKTAPERKGSHTLSPENLYKTLG